MKHSMVLHHQAAIRMAKAMPAETNLTWVAMTAVPKAVFAGRYRQMYGLDHGQPLTTGGMPGAPQAMLLNTLIFKDRT